MVGYKLSKNDWVTPFFVIFRSVREKLLVTVFFDHPVSLDVCIICDCATQSLCLLSNRWFCASNAAPFLWSDLSLGYLSIQNSLFSSLWLLSHSLLFDRYMISSGASSAWRSHRAVPQAACPEVQLWQDDLQVWHCIVGQLSILQVLPTWWLCNSVNTEMMTVAF